MLGEFLSRRLGLEYVSRQDLIDGVVLTQTAYGAEIGNLTSNQNYPLDMVEGLVLGRLRESDCQDKVQILFAFPYSFAGVDSGWMARDCRTRRYHASEQFESVDCFSS